MLTICGEANTFCAQLEHFLRVSGTQKARLGIIGDGMQLIGRSIELIGKERAISLPDIGIWYANRAHEGRKGPGGVGIF